MATKNTLLLLKVGGGLITVKRTPLTSKPAVIRSVAREIAAVKAAYDFDMIIATGAGSFGHFTAHEYGLRQGAQTNDQFYGAIRAHAEAADLNARFTRALITASLPAISIAPSAIMTCRAGEVASINVSSIVACLGSGSIPVLHGDTIFDASRGITILSGERVLEACQLQLQQHYQHTIVVYLTNEKGVLDRHGELLPELSRKTPLHINGSAAHDVTGGMEEKVIYARRAAQLGAAPVYIASGHDKEILTKLMSGQPVAGTHVL